MKVSVTLGMCDVRRVEKNQPVLSSHFRNIFRKNRVFSQEIYGTDEIVPVWAFFLRVWSVLVLTLRCFSVSTSGEEYPPYHVVALSLAGMRPVINLRHTFFGGPITVFLRGPVRLCNVAKWTITPGDVYIL